MQKCWLLFQNSKLQIQNSCSAKTLCFPDHPDEYAYRIMVKGAPQVDVEKHLAEQWQAEGKNFTQESLQRKARTLILSQRIDLIGKIKTVFLDPYFDYAGKTDPIECREPYKSNEAGERDYRNFGDANSDPGDIFCFFVRIKSDVLSDFIENDLLRGGQARFLEHLFPEVMLENYKGNQAFLHKAEDLFVFHHSLNLTRILYVSLVLPDEWQAFLAQNNGNLDKSY